MVSECLQWVREPAKEVNKNTVAVVLTDKKGDSLCTTKCFHDNSHVYTPALLHFAHI